MRARRAAAAVLALVVVTAAVSAACTRRPPVTRPPAGGADGPMHMPADFPTGVTVDPSRPFLTGDHADPFMLRDGTGYHLYTTNTGFTHLPAHPDDPSGTPPFDVDALPALPSWTAPGDVWAPVVATTGSGYVLWYATRDVASDRQCLSVATSSTPLGPFADASPGPAVCPRDLGGAIDPSIVVDGSGAPFLLYKSDGNCCGLRTAIWSQRLAPDLRSTQGAPVRLITDDQPWEDGIVEAPAMRRLGDRWYLFYSGNRWDTADYAVGYAVCDSVTGPCTKPRSAPWFSGPSAARGPGGQEFFTDAQGATWMVYAAWVGAVGYPQGGARNLFLAPIRIDGGEPSAIL